MVIFIYQNLKLTSSIVNPLTVSDVFVCLCRPIELQGGPKKVGPQTHDHNSVKS